MQPLNQIIKTLDLEEIELNHYLATSPNEGWQRVYGGQVIGQALVAASRTVSPNRSAHSLHAYFLRAGDTTIPILYKVDRIRDGKSFTTRRVIAVQRGQAIFTMSISFQVDEGGLSHQFDMPKVPAPDSLPTEDELRREQAKSWPKEFQESFSGSSAIQVKPVDPVDLLNPEPAQAMQRCWMRCGEALPGDPRIHQCALAYLSDWSLLDTASRPHAVSFMQDNVQVASLDHAMWFHRPFRADDWMLYTQSSPASSGGRGLNFGHVFTHDGTLVCSMSQEGLIRLHD